ncbi:MAG: sulfur carrier protein [Actinomycetota bacterium]|jgi:sulfur carrier protein|nr:sulfur carrier protein [Actinomycetota bacterium]
MNITLNGQAETVTDGVTVASIVESLHSGDASLGIAVALNGEVVPKQRWSATSPSEGDHIEILRAIGGGAW